MRLKPTVAEVASLEAIRAELAVVRLGEASAVDSVLPPIRELLGTETIMVLSPVDRGDGLEIERFHADGFAAAPELARRFATFLRAAPPRYAWYDAVRPEPAQRNRVIEAHDLMGPGELEASAIYHQVLRPLRLHAHRQPRVLLCDGPSLLGWFGAFHAGAIESRQKQLLRALIPMMRRRLAFERRLATTPRAYAALETCLEQLGAPAFVVTGAGRIAETNEAGRSLLAVHGAELRSALRDRLQGRPTSLALELTLLEQRGAARSYLAILRGDAADARISSSIASATRRWSLTPRQRDVLDHVVRGQATATIAAWLGISVRAVELHVTAMFDRVGVDSRAALVAAVLLAE
ncbi:MAG: helix-turn-helix transcriptional regulator [Myxococcota bacterium]|nr:helix-turn-helix transcriptional regulator [Myxococcota bacterium]